MHSMRGLERLTCCVSVLDCYLAACSLNLYIAVAGSLADAFARMLREKDAVFKAYR